jgi:hypothetical protein
MNKADEFSDFHKTLESSSVRASREGHYFCAGVRTRTVSLYVHGLGAGTNKTLMKTMVGNWNRLHGMELNCEAGNEVEFHYLSA